MDVEMLIEDDPCRNRRGIPELPPLTVEPSARLEAFRQQVSGKIAVRYMLIATVDSFDAPASKLVVKQRFLERFGEPLAASGYEASEVFQGAVRCCLAEKLVNGDDAGLFGPFRPSRRT